LNKGEAMALPICHLIMLEGDGGYVPFVDVCVYLYTPLTV